MVRSYMNPESFGGNYIVNLLALLYDAPLEYFQELFNPKGQLYRPVYYLNMLNPKDRYVNPKNLIEFSKGTGFTIPSGMPWDFPGVKAMKLFSLLIYGLICGDSNDRPDLSSLLPISR